MKVEFINPFLNAAMKVMETMAQIKPVPERPYLKQGHVAAGDISGVIGLAGDIKGSVAVSFSTGCAIEIVSSMLGETIFSITEDVRDAVGEITNMISGDARREISNLGYIVEAGIPTVIVGKNHTIQHITKSPCIVIPFTTGKGKFVVEASLEEKVKKA